MAVHDSDRPVAIDSSGLSLSWRMAALGVGLIVSFVVFMVTVFPFLFSMSKGITVATRDYVDQKADDLSSFQARQIDGVKAEIKALTSRVEVGTEGLTRIESSLMKQRASQEAARVTATIRSASERVDVYQRVYEANLTRLQKGEEPVKPQDVGDYR